MKKSRKLFALLSFCVLVFAGCASTSAEKQVVIRSKGVLNVGNANNPLMATGLSGIWTVNPHESLENRIKYGSVFPVGIVDKKTGETVYVIEDAVVFWQGISGWNGMINNDYSIVTKGTIDFIVSHTKYDLSYDDRFQVDCGPLQETDVKNIWIVKPDFGMKNLIDNTNDSRTFSLSFSKKDSDVIVLEVDNVVTSWEGITGWSGMVDNDYTFVTKDAKQYIVDRDYFKPNYDERYIYNSSNIPLNKSDKLEGCWMIKPSIVSKKIIEKGDTYKVIVHDINTNEVVAEYSNVVLDWQGIGGWNNQIDNDLSLITTDIEQWVYSHKLYTMEKVE